jgi:Response regulator containing CheY-like receiver, AAA-type ATPase, and DNA-binding domains
MRFLIIDDEDFKVKRISNCLKGYTVDKATSYVSAIDKIHNNAYNGIFLDMGFPAFEDGSEYDREQGLNVLDEMKRIGDTTPVIIYSGRYSDVSSYTNISDYLPTDIDTERFMACISDLVHKR